VPLRNRLTTLAALAALSLIAAWPLLRYGPPLQAEAITDGPNHLYRFALLDWHMRHGDLFPRWFADLHFGFGAPVLNFYAPLSYYILLAVHTFVPSFPLAFMWGFALSMPVAVVGMFLWARDQFESPTAGMVAGAAYTLTPYVYFSILDRSAYPEMWGLALAPWLFWLALRLIRQPSRAARIAFTLMCAAFLLTHNLSALLLTPILLLYGALIAPAERGANRLQRLIPLGGSFAQAVGIAAFFLIPFIAESPNIQLERTSAYDYAANFGTAADLFSAPVPFDPHHVVNIRPISVPWPQLALAFATTVAIFFRRLRREWRPAAIAFLLLASLLIFMNLRASLPLWNVLPIAKQIQFPFRLLGPAMLLLAWLCGACISLFAAPSRHRFVALASVASIFFFTLTWTFHAPFDHFPDIIRPPDIIRDEIAHPTRLGTTNLQEFLPRWVAELPSPDTTLPRYAKSDIPSRLAPLDSNVTLIEERTSLTAHTLTYESFDSFTATYNIFYFPGWEARLDGEPLPITVSSPHGLITLPLPPGRHTLHLSLQPTPPQIVGTLISIVALLALLIPLPLASRSFNPPILPSPALPLAFPLLLISLLITRIALDFIQSPFNRSLIDHLPNPSATHFGNHLRLLGFDFPRGTSLSSGSSLPVTLFWQAVTPLTVEYHTSIQLANPLGQRFGQSDHQHPAGIPTPRWRTDQYARDAHLLPALPGTPPGAYRVLLIVYADSPLSVMSDGVPSGVEFELGTVTLSRGQPLPPGPLRLIDSDIAGGAFSVGDPLPFTLLWSSGNEPIDGLAASVTLTSAHGDVLLSQSFPPAGPDYPSSLWSANELIRYPHRLDLPPDLPAGPARLALTFSRADGSPASETFALGEVTITVPERSFDVPPMAHRVNHDFGGVIRLLGYEVGSEAITLYWQSLQPVAVRYTVFLHTFDEGGNFVGGQDAPPPRPTTSWLPGEVIADVRQYAVGERFEVGLYDPATGDRVGEPFAANR